MSERFNQLATHHSNLRVRCALQRELLGQTADQIENRLSGVDRTVAIVRGLARKPALVVAGIALVALIGPARLLRLASRGAVFYSTARRVMRAVR
jgi:hypothetical protein